MTNCLICLQNPRCKVKFPPKIYTSSNFDDKKYVEFLFKFVLSNWHVWVNNVFVFLIVQKVLFLTFYTAVCEIVQGVYTAALWIWNHIIIFHKKNEYLQHEKCREITKCIENIGLFNKLRCFAICIMTTHAQENMLQIGKCNSYLSPLVLSAILEVFTHLRLYSIQNSDHIRAKIKNQGR